MNSGPLAVAEGTTLPMLEALSRPWRTAVGEGCGREMSMPLAWPWAIRPGWGDDR